MSMVKCRTCGSLKASGDICAGCGAGMPKETMRVRYFGSHTTNRVYGVQQTERDVKAYARKSVEQGYAMGLING